MKKQSNSTPQKGGGGIPANTLRELYVSMLRLRKVEEKVAELLESESEIICPVHLYTGQEAVAVGVCANLLKDDYVFSTHRSHGHYLAKGGDVRALMAELYTRSTGCSRGRGGSMHLASPDIGLPGSSAIVAGTISLAVGAALAFSIRKADNVAVCFFGDGAVGEGIFYESLNFASLKKLPVIFVCENNLYSTHMSISVSLADTDIHKKAGIFNMPGTRIDGSNITEIYETAKQAIENARAGKGPALLECMTYRWRGHVGPNYDLDKGLRDKAELDSWIAKCPVKTLEELLLADKIISEAERDRVGQDLDIEIETALDFARNSPLPDESELYLGVFKN